MTQLDSALRKAFAAQRVAQDRGRSQAAQDDAPVRPADPGVPAASTRPTGEPHPGGPLMPSPTASAAVYGWDATPGQEATSDALTVGEVRQRIRRRQASIRRTASTRHDGSHLADAYAPAEWNAPVGGAPAAELRLNERIRSVVADELARQPLPAARVTPESRPEGTFDAVRRQGEELARIIVEIRDREQTLASRESDVCRREQGLADQESRLAVLRSTLDRRAEDLSVREATLSDREMTLREAADRLARETDSLRQEREDVAARRAALDEEGRRLEAARTELDAERQVWTRQRDELAAQEAQLATTRRTIAVQSKAIAASEVELTKLRQDLTKQQAEQRDAEKRLAAEMAGFRTQSAETEAKASALESRASELSGRLEELTRREADLLRTEQEVKSQQGRLKQREAELKLRQAALQQREADLKAQEGQLLSDLDACHSQRAELTDQETRVQAQQSDLEERAALIRQQQEVLLTQLAQVTSGPSAKVEPAARPVQAEVKVQAVAPVAAAPAVAASRPTSTLPAAAANARQRVSAEEWAVLTGADGGHESAAAEPVADAAVAPARSAEADLPATAVAPAAETLAALTAAGTHRLDRAEEAVARPHAGRVASAVAAGVADDLLAATVGGSVALGGTAALVAGPSAPSMRGHEAAPSTFDRHHPDADGGRPGTAWMPPATGGDGGGAATRSGSSSWSADGAKTLPTGDHSAADLATIRSLWEVDRWEWPAVVGSVSEMLGDALEAAGRRLVQEAESGRKVWAIGSIGRGCGATTVACCLARWAGRAGLDTILVDANFSDPDLAVQFDLGQEVCWSETLRGAQPWAESTITSLGDRVTLAPLVQPPDVSRIGSLARRMSRAIDAVRPAYDLVLVDVPAFGAPLATDLTGCYDAALIITDGTAAQATRCREVRDQLKAAGVRPIFVVENRIDDAGASAS